MDQGESGGTVRPWYSVLRPVFRAFDCDRDARVVLLESCKKACKIAHMFVTSGLHDGTHWHISLRSLDSNGLVTALHVCVSSLCHIT